MAKRVDITNKLSFEENPKLVISGKEYEVNADAETVLRVMNLISAENVTPSALTEALPLIFTEKAQADLADLRLNFDDYRTVIMCAIDLIVGNDEGE